MISETIEFEDLRGNKIVETFHFRLTEAEMMEMAARHHVKGGSELLDYFEIISEAEDGNAMMDAFKSIISKTVGVVDEDGVRFIKSPEITSRFMDSDAYNKLFVRMLSDPEYALKFLNGVMPAAVQKKIAEEQKHDRQYSRDELLEMSEEDFKKVAGKNPKDWSPEHLLIAYHRTELKKEQAA